MKKTRGIFTGICVILVITAGVIALVRYQKNKGRADLAERIYDAGAGPPETIEGLREAIAGYEQEIERHVKIAAQTGVYWKILATRLQDKGLHNEALAALQQAIRYTPADPSLHYLAGVSAGIAAKGALGFDGDAGAERTRLLDLAEEAYREAIALDPKYARPMYGLAVLYVFELDRPAEAIPLLETYLGIARSDTEARFLLARAFYGAGRFREAIDTCDALLSSSKDEDKNKVTRDLRRMAERRLYE
ncbi:MAG: tetratricopeptide repeat protein [Treponema sp.]|jgi:cytochrome c-type biogenesis protein CcmH/NrfG|nr:tetratricopeptide repeat protein [Treponema sp.]